MAGKPTLPPAPPRHGRTTSDIIATARRMILASGRRAAWDDPYTLAELAELRAALDEALAIAVAGQRNTGMTWASIGEALGTTKQAAIMRWANRP